MHTVWIPSLYRDLTGGLETVDVEGATVREVIAALDERYPGIQARLCDEEDDRIRPHISVAVNGEVSYRGLRHKLREPSEIHFVPAIGGGRQ